MVIEQPAVDLFGSKLVAMVTPMEPDGAVSARGVSDLVQHLVSGGCDGIVVLGTTGEAPTLTEPESAELVRTVASLAGGAARVIAGVGTYDTAGSVRRARAAQAGGADALLLVCPYYSRPTQEGVIAHCTAVADATDLPVMLYDVPARTASELTEDTILELTQHPRIRAIKDAKGDLFEAMSIMARTDLAYYCGIDELNLPHLASGATGVVSVVANVVPDRVGRLVDAVRGGDLDSARRLQRELLPLTGAIMRTSQGAITAKVALAHLGIIPHASVRLPLVASSPEDARRVTYAIEALGVPALAGR